MCALINITKSDAKPLYIESSDVSAIQVFSNGNISIFTSAGRQPPINIKDWAVDAADIAQKLADDGNPLFCLQANHVGDKQFFYISPSSVSFLRVNKPRQGKVTLAFGIKGGWLDGTTTQAEVDALVAAVSATKTFNKYLPEDCFDGARFRDNQAAMYIDPKLVTQISNSGGRQVDVRFEGSGGSLLVEMKDLEADATIVAKDWPRPLSQQSMEAAFDEAARRQTAEEQATMNFVNTIATQNSGLIAIPGCIGATHIRREDIGYITSYDDKRLGEYTLVINAPGDSTKYLEVSFKTAKQRQQALKALGCRPTVPKTAQKPTDSPKP